MDDLLDLYARPHDPAEPVVCVDEKTKQLVEDVRPPLPLAPVHGRREDYHYRRKGTRNIFVAVDPKGGWRATRVTRRKTKVEYAEFLAAVVASYPGARVLHVVHDNFATHSLKCLREVLGPGHPLFARVEFHPTPVHGSWLNPAELEIGVMDRQCLNRRMGEEGRLVSEVSAWTEDRNARGVKINWRFTREKAREVFKLEMHQIS